jgi:1-deoxy-D-xylulose-5-phosphate reductoisomerase
MSATANNIGNLAVLGSTGSIGVQTLEVVRKYPDKYKIVSLSAGSNIELLESQVREFKPKLVAVADEEAGRKLEEKIGSLCKVEIGKEALITASTLSEVHTVCAAVLGFAGLESTLSAIRANKHIALSNKETLVAGGSLVKQALESSTSCLIPVDSEHNSIFQCLPADYRSNPSIKKSIKKIILTASGGPFLGKSRNELNEISPEQAVKHPRWNMGAKISVDSATMFNKALEVIEAHWLFDLPTEQIDVLIHPQSAVHGIVEFKDGSSLALVSKTDMQLPIAHALSYLRCLDPKTSPGARENESVCGYLDLGEIGELTFIKPDLQRFPALKLAYQVLEIGGTAPAVLNAANEIAVSSFLNRQIKFLEIEELVINVLGYHRSIQNPTFEEICFADNWAREKAREFAKKLL